MERKHFNIDGLANENMKTQVKNALRKIDGVSDVCVDLGRGSIEVMYNEPATQQEIQSCIEKTGHNTSEN